MLSMAMDGRHGRHLMDVKWSISELEYPLSFIVRMDIFTNFANKVKTKFINVLTL